MICELGDRVWVSSILLLIYWILKWQPVVELKIKSYWLQRTVDLLILSRVCSRCLSINSAFCCWFVDLWNGTMQKNPKFGGTGRKSLLICWFYLGFELGLWVSIARFAVDLLIFEMAACERTQNLGELVAKACWFVDFI